MDALVTPDLDEGLREQLARFDRRLAAGMPRAGWKICVNDLRMQKRLGIDGPFVGFLDGAKALASGEAWTVDPDAILGVEPELAIRFRSRLEGSPGDDDIRSAIEGVAPAIEVVDWRDARLDLVSLASSASFHAGFVTGELAPFDRVPVIGDGCPVFRRGDDVIGVPDPTLVPDDLVGLVARVSAMLGRYGRSIEAGDWLLCGACTNPARVEPGDAIEAEFGTLGRVRVRFQISDTFSRQGKYT